MAGTVKPIQAQPFTLVGAGALQGDTTLTLSSFKGIDGSNLLTADLGTKAYGTIEPGNGAQEEQISFTGVTQNANGTATLTGVHSVEFISPYTETSGLSVTHPGATTFILTNTSGYYSQFLTYNNDATITAVFTFTDPDYPRINSPLSNPTLPEMFATKHYVDNVVLNGAPAASTSVQGNVQLATQAQVDAKTTTGSTGASLVPTMAEYRSTLLSDYVVDTGAADAYVITPVPAISAYATGQIFTFKAVHANTTTSTLNVNGKGATTIKKVGGGTNLAANDILAGQIVFVEYDGTNFQMLNPPAVTLPAISSSNINEFIGTTDGATFSFQRPFDYQSFTSSGTWTKPTNLSGNEMVKVQVWGAGGGGGGTGAANRAAGGGGGGGYSENIYRASDLSATVTVTIGAGGAGGSAGDNDGVAGGATTFGAFMGGGGGGLGRKGSVATGGTGGAAMSQVGAQIFAGGVAGAVQDGIGGSSTYGGGGGGAGTDNNTTGTGGIGGLSYFGCGGGGGGSVDTTGGAGGVGRTGYGGTGGAGGAASAGGVAATTIGAGGGGGGGGTVAGGAGFRGECRVWVFF